jgi:rubrerythrin
MNEFTKLAILNAIKIEKASYDFYRLAAACAKDAETTTLLNNLASEEFEHLVGFVKLYPGAKSDITSLTSGISGSFNINPSEHQNLHNNLDNREMVLSIAMKEERSCIELYSTYVATIRDQEVHDMFKKALDETKNHLDTIDAEYAFCMGMVNDADIDTYVRE